MRRFVITQPGSGNVTVDDLRGFLRDITSDKAVDWFGNQPQSKTFAYLVME